MHCQKNQVSNLYFTNDRRIIVLQKNNYDTRNLSEDEMIT